jgi:hypothetical protein
LLFRPWRRLRLSVTYFTIKAAHIAELQQAAHAVRALANLSPVTLTPSPPGMFIDDAYISGCTRRCTCEQRNAGPGERNDELGVRIESELASNGGFGTYNASTDQKPVALTRLVPSTVPLLFPRPSVVDDTFLFVGGEGCARVVVGRGRRKRADLDRSWCRRFATVSSRAR